MSKITQGIDGAPHGCHECAPRDWRNIPAVTGSYELDASIARSRNGDLPVRMSLYCPSDTIYGARTGYDGYRGYHGDD